MSLSGQNTLFSTLKIEEMNRPRNLREDETLKVVTLLNEGCSQQYVANLLGVRQSTISQIVNPFGELGSYQDKVIRSLQMEESHLKKQAFYQFRALAAVRNIVIFGRTVRRRFNGGSNSRRPAIAPLLTNKHTVTRLRFAREHVNWTTDDSKRILFSDETRVSLNSPDGCQQFWRRPEERYAICTISPRILFFSGSIMFWGGICFHGRTDLVHIWGRSMNAHFYVKNIVEEHVMSFASFDGNNFIFM